MAAALEGDRQGAIETALEFMAEKNSRATVISDLFGGAQQRVADVWHVGGATSVDEYRVFVAIEQAMGVLPRPRVRPGVRPGSRMLLATLAPERHDLGIRLAAMALTDDGWAVDVVSGIDPIYLAASASQSGADLVGISSTFPTPHTRAQLAYVVRSVHAIGMSVLVGGAAFVRAPGLAEQIQADAFAPDARSGLILARRLRLESRQISGSRLARGRAS